MLNVAFASPLHLFCAMFREAALVLLPPVRRDFLVGPVRPSICDTYCEFEGSGRSVIHAISSWLPSAVAKAISPKALAAAISEAIKGSPCLKATVPHKDSLCRDRGKKEGAEVCKQRENQNDSRTPSARRPANEEQGDLVRVYPCARVKMDVFCVD